MSIHSLLKKLFVKDELIILINNRNNYEKKITYDKKKEEEQKIYKRNLEESYLIDSIEEEKRKQLIEKETIILYAIQILKEMQDTSSVTFEQLQQLIKTLEAIVNLINNPYLKELFEISFNSIKEFNNKLKNKEIILTENNCKEIEEKSSKLILEIENSHNSNNHDELIEAVCNFINAIYYIVEAMSHNQVRISLQQKFEYSHSKSSENLPPMEKSIHALMKNTI